MTHPALTVVIPTHGRPDLLQRTLETLAACELPPGYQRTVVIENGEKSHVEPCVRQLAAQHPPLRLHYSYLEWANKSAALNAALAEIDGGLVVFFDDDVEISAGTLMAYAAAAATTPSPAFFGGPFVARYDRAPADWLVPMLPYSVRGVSFDGGDRPDEYLGFNWAAWVDDVKRVGGFDPNYGPGSPTGSSGQETEMQDRLLAIGCQAVDVADAWVSHYVPPERCSPEYAVWWGGRRGVATSLLARAQGESAVTLVGRGIGGGARAAAGYVLKTVRGDGEGRWRSARNLRFFRGLVQGALRRVEP